MKWINLKRVVGSEQAPDDDAAVLSRRQVLAGIGVAGVCVVAASTLLTSKAVADRALPAGTPN
ncbi:MAG: twin-arginine translocation signal domain-containing protein, partial [Xanthobacteraceae bacterium]